MVGADPGSFGDGASVTARTAWPLAGGNPTVL